MKKRGTKIEAEKISELKEVKEDNAIKEKKVIR